MKHLLCLALTFSAALLGAQTSPHTISLPTSKQLTVPSPGHLSSLNGFAPTIALSPDSRYAAILNDGYGSEKAKAHQSIAVLDLTSNELIDFPEERLPENAHQSYFIGLAFSSDGSHLYASFGSITDPTGARPGDTGNGIAVYRFHNGKIAWERFLKISPQKVSPGKMIAYGVNKTGKGTVLPYPAGMAVIAKVSAEGKPAADKILIANNYSDNAILLDSSDGYVLQSFDLSTNEMIPSSFPYTVVATKDGKRAWCSLWNASRVVELDLQKGTVVHSIPLLEPDDPTGPGSHPTSLLLSQDEKTLYVALSNAGRIAAVSTAAGKLMALFESATPVGLAQSADGKRLFAAEATTNSVAVFDTSNLHEADTGAVSVSTSLGLIPTDWYPTTLATVGDDLLIATSKGEGAGPNNGFSKMQFARRHREHPYIPTLLYGSLARLNYRKIEGELPELTRRVQDSNLFNADPGHIQFAQGSNRIHHVIYIIKENRTYDQVFGDLNAGGAKVGNGDPSLTMYGLDVTPNEHKLALQFGVLDNFYDSGEVSGDGHDWSTAAITSDYNEQTWQIGYRSRERTYDYQGGVADEIPMDHGAPDVDDPSTGYIWDNVAKHHLTYRDYGEYVGTVWCKEKKLTKTKISGDKSPKEGPPSPLEAECAKPPINQGEPLPAELGQPHGSPSPWPWPIPRAYRNVATKAVLRGHFDERFPTFNTEYPDQFRADEFLNEFDGFVKARTVSREAKAKNGELPNFVLLYLPDDHTHGTMAGKPRPAASVADNDLALGRIVDAVSHSPYWDDTAILVLEDDAQDGADHVDAHRSIAFVISRYSPNTPGHPFVDSRFYTTVNMIHTLETLLGLPPMNGNDTYAPVMAPLFTGSGNQPAFTADWSNLKNGLIYQTNNAKAHGAAESAKMDFTRPDANNPRLLNAILWRDRKGEAPEPKPRHAVFPQN